VQLTVANDNLMMSKLMNGTITGDKGNLAELWFVHDLVALFTNTLATGQLTTAYCSA